MTGYGLTFRAATSTALPALSFCRHAMGAPAFIILANGLSA